MYKIVRFFLFLFNPEFIHHISFKLIKFGAMLSAASVVASPFANCPGCVITCSALFEESAVFVEGYKLTNILLKH